MVEHTVDGLRKAVAVVVLLGKFTLLSVLIELGVTMVVDFWWTLGTEPLREGFLRNISRVN